MSKILILTISIFVLWVLISLAKSAEKAKEEARQKQEFADDDVQFA